MKEEHHYKNNNRILGKQRLSAHLRRSPVVTGGLRWDGITSQHEKQDVQTIESTLTGRKKLLPEVRDIGSRTTNGKATMPSGVKGGCAWPLRTPGD